MEKNTIWAISLSTVVLVAFFAVQTFLFPRKEPVAQNKADSQKVEQKAESASSAENTETFLSEPSENASEIAQAAEENFVIETNKLKVTFTNKGGDVIGFELKDHFDRDTGKGVEMINNVSAKNRAFALSFGDVDADIVDKIFDVKIDEANKKIGFSKAYADFTVYKVYTFKDDEYLFKLDIDIIGNENFKGLNKNGAAYSLRTSPQIGPRFNPKDRYDVREFIAYDIANEKKFTPKKDNEKDWSWVAVAGKYFEIIVNPEDSVEKLNAVKLIAPDKKNENSNTQLVLSRKACDSSVKDSYFIYVGPRNEADLKIYATADKNSWNVGGKSLTESLPTSGILNWLEIILRFVMKLIYKIIPNWGVSIIIMTILLKFALFPLTKKSLEGTQKLQEVQPKLQALQEKYKDDRQKLQQEQMKLYQQVGYNPMSGCLPLVIQFVVLWAMYHLFNNYFEFRGASFISGWISDLSSTDNVLTLGFSIPWLGNELHILPIIYLISQLLFGKITQNGGTAAGQSAAQMKMMMYAMPIVFFFLFYNAPSGLLLYWTVSNVFQLFQQLFVNRMMKKRKFAPKSAKSATVFNNKKNNKK
ncbi:MAG: membrane protein insertase YidC [Treponema sp.]|nr:membrane protein insertase YidC [Treponema sp.]